jgi:DnaK suppressor protein
MAGTATKKTKTTIKKAVSEKPKKEARRTKVSSHSAKQVQPILDSNSVVTMTTVNKPASQIKDFTGIGYLGIPAYSEQQGEEYMCLKQRDHFREILWAWKRSLMEEVDRTILHLKEEAGNNFADSNDRASQEEGFNLELRTRDRERKLIKKIDEALERLERDDYGYCEGCGIEIGIRRLEARPTATLCIDCKTLDEIREKQTKGG